MTDSRLCADLTAYYLVSLQSGGLDASENSYRAANTLVLLLQQWPADMDGTFQLDTVKRICQLLRKLHKLRCASAR